MCAIKRQSRDDDTASASKRERKVDEEEVEGRERKRTKRSSVLRKSDDRSHDRVQLIISTSRTKIVPTIELLDNVFETMEDSLAIKVQNRLQTSEGREVLRIDLGPLS